MMDMVLKWCRRVEPEPTSGESLALDNPPNVNIYAVDPNLQCTGINLGFAWYVDCCRDVRCRGGLGVAAASGEAHSTQGLLEVWQSSQGLGRLEEVGRVVVVQSLQD